MTGAALTVWLAACGGSQPAQPAAVATAPEREAITATPAGIEVELPLVEPGTALPPWQLPVASVPAEEWSRARRQLSRALDEGRLFETANDAVPLLLAMEKLRPADRWLAHQRGVLVRRLDQQFHRLLEEPQRQRVAVLAARQRLTVLQVLEGDLPRQQARVDMLEQAEQLLTLNRRGEAALRNGRLGLDGPGALADFRLVLEIDPRNARAQQGVAAVESALLRRALESARRAEFASAGRWLERAASVVSRSDRQQMVAALVEQERHLAMEQLQQGILQDIQRAAGLKSARARLDRMRQIAHAGDGRVDRMATRIELATRYGLYAPGQALRDRLAGGGYGPQMVVVPAGQFQMGAGDDEPGAVDAERPAHPVRFERGFAIAATEITVGQFRQFVQATGARPRATRRGHSMVYEPRTGNFIRRSGVDWQHGHDGLSAPENAPVMHVSVRDAEAYAAWLSAQTGHHYRLPSEAEFEYVLRAGTVGRYPWGNAATPPPQVGNLTGSEDVSPTGRQWSNAFPGYGDGWWGVAPAGSFRPNAWGVYDMEGNLSEWVGDCWHASYRRAPADGATWYNPGCRQRVVRGANWANAPVQARAAWRWQQESDVTSGRIGFRVVRGL